MSDPPFPWQLRPLGPAWASVHFVNADAARRHVPASFRILQVLPGWTLGGLFLVHYGPGSILEYRELVAIPAVVWRRGRYYAWVSHVYVDSADSRRGGREGLGVPKQQARFEAHPGDPDTTVVVGTGGWLCKLRFRRTLGLWRWRFRFRAAHFHAKAPDRSLVSVHGNVLTGRVLLGGARIEIAPASPLATLGLGRPLFAVGVENAEALFGGAPFLPFRTLAADAD